MRLPPNIDVGCDAKLPFPLVLFIFIVLRA